VGAGPISCFHDLFQLLPFHGNMPMNPTLSRTSAIEPRAIAPEGESPRAASWPGRPQARNGGAPATNATGRFRASEARGFRRWPGRADEALEAAGHRSDVGKSPGPIITRQRVARHWIRSLDQSYRGLASTGAFYCYARPTHTYMGLSAGARFRKPSCSPKRGAARASDRREACLA